MNDTIRFVTCPCGARVESALRDAWSTTGEIELRCRCGRRLEVEAGEAGWTLRGELVPEGSVPVEGFSRELRGAPDVERFWFEARDDAHRRVPVHIVFSPSAGVAEVKHSAVKPLRLTGIARPTEARRAWMTAYATRRTRRGSRVQDEISAR